ncbi:hypothetical protein FA09DRAFT_301049 [Tilletiopsis washingtonensis]|uniref:Pirin n=1 Tax=Tilletiopsis washingtonensis TaxID=58919 RepID=A0A316Z1Y2_9BASI|nr:hypothetical protein FA09DRAFT_301049 [Tilletiopsis washingtonensis]PWN95800.1 hypothetical protein FA09DRAFT_301049 [Tilletiopsis washingtonensis]
MSANASTAMLSRSVVKKVPAIETPEGAGAIVRRSIGTPALRNLSPFLMYDHFHAPEGAGFPDHPHRGMTTVTYVLQGAFQHEDFMGNAGIIGPGASQVMSAGRGVVHAEMPLHRDAQGNKLPDPVGLQLWIDLPEESKMSEPYYQEFTAEEMPTARPRPSEPIETEGSDWEIKILAGESHGVKSPVRSPERGQCWYLDVRLNKPGARVFQPIPTGWTAFIYVGDSAPIKVGDDASLAAHEKFHTLVLSNKAVVTDPKTDPSTGEEGRAFVIAGMPLDQTVYQHGPFVMTSAAEIRQAFEDYQYGQNGFERAPGWRSKIGGQ